MPVEPGSRFGPYEVLSPLGAGGMGEVYRARDTRLDRPVALKVLSSASSEDASRLERFRREARAISRLSHPHICALHDVGDQDGVAFLVMEYIEGETLAQRLEAGALPLKQALEYGVQIAEALSVAHRQGVTHRDLKPANVMLTAQGVKLLDFGLAKLTPAEPDRQAATESLHLTEEGVLLGTVAYMAPEQVEGEEADSRTDIFALGVVLYEMVTGHRPFVGKSRASLVAAILSGEPAPVSIHQPLTPPALEHVVGRCLAKDREGRWQTARDVATELRWIRDAGSQPGTQASAPSARRRRRRVAWVAAAAAATSGSLFAAGWALHTRSRQPTYTRVTFRRGIVAAARFAPDRESIVYSASWEGHPYEVFLTRLGSTESRSLGLTRAKITSVSSAGEMAVVIGQQNFRTAYGTLVRTSLAGGLPRELLESVHEADWTPDGSQLAVLRELEGPAQLEFPMGTKIYQSNAALWSMRVSPRGDRVALIEGPNYDLSFGHALAVVDAAGKKTTLIADFHIAEGLAWSPDGREVWVSANRDDGPPNLRAVSLSGEERVLDRVPDWLFLQDVSRDGRVLVTKSTVSASARCLVPGETTERDLTWLDNSFVKDLSADGKTLLLLEGLAGARGTDRTYVRSTDGSPAVKLGDDHPMSLSPDGKWVLAKVRSYESGEWVLLPTGPGSRRVLPRGAVVRSFNGDWLPNGRQIVFAGEEEGRGTRVYVQDVEGGALRAVTPEGCRLADAVPPDGLAALVFLNGQWLLYPFDGGDPRPVPYLTPRDNPRQWSADGRFVYIYGRRGLPLQIHRLDITTGRRELWRTLAPPDPVGIESIRAAVITPDGNGYCYWTLRTLSDLYLVEGLK